MPSRGTWNTLISAGDPELEKFAERVAAMVPADSPLRSEIVQRLFGVFKGWAESKAERLPPLSGAALEKATDFGDFLTSNLKGKGGPKATKAAQDWMDRFFIDAGERLTKAPDPQVETQRIKSEFELRRQLLEVIEAARRATQPPAEIPQTLPINWQELDQKLAQVVAPEIENANTKLAAIRDQLKARVEARRHP